MILIIMREKIIIDFNHSGLLVHFAARNDVVFNGARADVETIMARVREEFGRWRLASLYRSDVLGVAEPVS
jgi:hypothetical protein